MSQNLKEEEKYLHKVLQSNGLTTQPLGMALKSYLKITQVMKEKGLILTIPYIARLSESIQRVCRDFDMKTAFKSGKTLRSHLTKVKDTIPITTESSIVYSIPCSSGKVYIGETTRTLEQRVKELMRRFQTLLNMLGIVLSSFTLCSVFRIKPGYL